VREIRSDKAPENIEDKAAVAIIDETRRPWTVGEMDPYWFSNWGITIIGPILVISHFGQNTTHDIPSK
jgi:hypothetical protein